MKQERVAFGFLEELMDVAHSADEPLTVQIELRVAGSLGEAALRDAIRKAMAVHPMTRARKAAPRFLLRPPVWELAEPDVSKVLQVLPCGDECELVDIRDRFYSAPIELDAAPALRVLLLKRAGGDSLLFAAHHAITDGIGGLRFLRSVARAYRGEADSPAPVDPLKARDLKAQFGGSQSHRAVRAVPPKTRSEPLAFAAAHGGAPMPGHGFVHRALSAEQRQNFNPRRFGPSVTLNDLLVAATHRVIESWNADHGVRCGRISAFIPFSLRPPEWYNEVVGNLTLGGKVSTTQAQRVSDETLIETVVSQTATIKMGGRLATILDLPAWFLRLIPVYLPRLCKLLGDRTENSAVLTYLGRVDRELPEFDSVAGPVTEVWGSPPVGMPAGISIGAGLLRGRLHLTLRYRRALFDRAAAARFFDTVVDELIKLADSRADVPPREALMIPDSALFDSISTSAVDLRTA
jgi:NRPS condensation-like uncharacterized protein